MGAPGSAILGPSLLDGFDFASVAPRQNYALGFHSGNCEIISNLDAVPASTGLSGASGTPEGVAWAADGTLAIAYSRSGNWIQSISGLPSNGAPGASIDIGSLGGTLVAVASGGHGNRIAVATRGQAGGVYLSTDGQSFVPVLNATTVIALSFSASGNTLYALDGSISALNVVDLNTFNSQILPLDGLANPFDLRSAQDSDGRELVYIASGTDQLMRIVDAGSGQVVGDVPLSVPPSSMESLGERSYVIASRSASNQPLWLFSSAPVPTSYFVPAVQSIAGGLQ